MNSKTTKRALLGSFTSLLLCFAMLIGSTFAWFTDTASTSVNTIQAGTLDVKLMMSTDGTNWTPAEGKTLNFIKAAGHENEDVLWEPGATYKLPQIKIVNNGNLALKYEVYLTATGGDLELADVLKVSMNGSAVQLNNQDATLADLLTAAAVPTTGHNGTIKGNLGTTENDKESGAISISMTMDESAGNTYQGMTINGIAVTVVATQDTVEYDSNGNRYDVDAKFPAVEVIGNNSAEVGSALRPDADATNPNVYLTLSEDTNLSVANLGQQTGGSGQYKLGNANTTEIVIDLAGHKLTIDTGYWSALGAQNPNATITIKNGSMNSVGNSANTWNAYDLTFYDCNWVFENVTFDKAVAFATGANATLKNVTINESNANAAAYAMWITAEGQTVNLDNVTIQSNGGYNTRAIAIKDEYVANPAKVTLNIKDSTISSASKAAVLVTSMAGADITAENVNISGVTADSTNLVWKDNGTTSTGEAYANAPVTVTGGSCITEP